MERVGDRVRKEGAAPTVAVGPRADADAERRQSRGGDGVGEGGGERGAGFGKEGGEGHEDEQGEEASAFKQGTPRSTSSPPPAIYTRTGIRRIWDPVQVPLIQ